MAIAYNIEIPLDEIKARRFDMTDPNAVFQQFAQQVADEFPEIQQILDEAKAGTITEGQALRDLSEIVMGNPDLSRRFQKVAMTALAPLRDEDRAKPLDHDGLIIHKKRGLPCLNPLVEAALAERAQFDGDIPEMRTGGLPVGAAPALSVDSNVRSPVAMGQMLETASQQVAKKVAAKEPERAQQIADTALLDMVEQAGTALVTSAQCDMILDGKSDVHDVPEYRRGHLPVLIKVTEPSGSALMALTPGEQRKSAWLFLSTTQGRRSAENGLAQLIAAKLQVAGFTNIKVRPYNPTSKGTVLAAHEWKVNIDGAGSIQPMFSLIDVAAMAIAKRLTTGAGIREHKVFLEVTSVDMVDIRSVGWAGRLVSDGSTLTADE